jgi:hypothetical protein
VLASLRLPSKDTPAHAVFFVRYIQSPLLFAAETQSIKYADWGPVRLGTFTMVKVCFAVDGKLWGRSMEMWFNPRRVSSATYSINSSYSVAIRLEPMPYCTSKGVLSSISKVAE